MGKKVGWETSGRGNHYSEVGRTIRNPLVRSILPTKQRGYESGNLPIPVGT